MLAVNTLTNTSYTVTGNQAALTKSLSASAGGPLKVNQGHLLAR